MNCLDLRNNYLIVTAYENKVEEIIESIKTYISNFDCKKLKIDISALNMLDAVRISAICAAAHFSKYPLGELEWIVKDFETKNFLKPLSLRTMKTSVKRPIIKNLQPAAKNKVTALG